jgi:hypothetical protein
LTCQKKCLGKTSFTAEFERSKVFVPLTLRNLGLRFHPNPELIQVLQIDIAVAHTLNQVISNSRREPRPRLDVRHELLHLLAKNKSAHFVAQSLYFIWVVSASKLFCQIKKSFFLFFTGFESLLDELNQNPVVAKAAFLCHVFDLLDELAGQGYASANRLGIGHATTIHHYGAMGCYSISDLSGL